ncbi:phage tail spike protein [Gracilibacillus dipsosauri]|uniref:phage tail spike protein n=1 Tax=Gracilibacillus dipsosauri TaxID=178340 RepID=UPI00240A280E
MSALGTFAKTFICESELGYLNDSAQRHGEYHNITPRQFLEVIIDNHNRDIANDDIDKTFVVGEVTVTNSTDNLYRYLGYESTLDTIFDKLIDRLGGELHVRKENGVRYLDYLQTTKVVKQTEIRLSKNLKSITREVDPSEIITRLVPLGERIESDNPDDVDASQARLTIESVNDGIDYLVDEEAEKAIGTTVVKSRVWDDITTPSILKTRGEQYLRENNRIRTMYNVTALDLSLIDLDVDSFEVGYYYPVINPIMGINEELRIVGKTTDIINPEQSFLNIGDQLKTASEYQNEANKSARKVVELEGTVGRQSQRIGQLVGEISNVNTEITNVQNLINNVDLENLPDAIQSLEDAISNLNDALDGIPIYDVATPTQDGLMAAADKAKLDALKVYQEATELQAGLMSAEDKQKLNRITVTQNIDLDNLLARIEALENQ